MFKRLVLSLMLVAGSVYGAEEVVEAVSMFTPEVQGLLDKWEVAYNATVGDVTARIELCKKAAHELKSVVGNENIELLKVAEEYELIAKIGECMRNLEDEAAARALYWVKIRSFVWDMFNPYAYADAVQKTWQAGWGNMFTTLWSDHKAVLAGTALITTAAGLLVAYKKGCFGPKEDDQNE